MFRSKPNSMSLPATKETSKSMNLGSKAGLLAALTVFFLTAGALVLPERHIAQAASLPGPAQQVTALSDGFACDFVSTPFSSFFGQFGFNNQFVNQGFFNPGFFNQGFFNPGFATPSSFTNFPPICVSDCNGSVPAVLISNICSAPVGAIAPISTLNSMSCGSNENLTF